MKPILLAVLCCVLTLQLGASPLSIENGEYANYLDTRNNLSFYRGYLVFHVENGHDSVFIRNRNLVSGKQRNYYAEIEYHADGSADIVSINGVTKDDPPEFRQSLVDFLNFYSMYNRNKNKITQAISVEDPWENYTLIYNFRPLLPLFSFSSIDFKGSDAPNYILESSGVLKPDQLSEFVAMGPSSDSEKPRKVAVIEIPPKPKMQVDINGLTVGLDANWSRNDAIGSPGYWLSVGSIRDSQISVEKVSVTFLSEKGLDDEKLCRLNVIGTKKVLYDTVYCQRKGERLQVGFAVLDELNRKNYQVFITKRVGDFYLMVNFSTFADIFDANLSYYKEIVDSLAAGM